MKGLAILILVVIFFWLIAPAIMRWARRKAIKRTQDYIFRSMGLDPDELRKNRSKSASSASSGSRQSRSRQHGRNQGSESIIPKEYAEDVEFVEIKDYSETEVRIKNGQNVKIYKESQVSDVEWVEIKKSGSK